MEGRVIAGRFRLEKEIGSGAMGSVWRAEHLALSVPVAIKLMSSDAARKADAMARFEREAKLAARIRSSYVVGVLDHGRDGELPYIVMEWLEGESLRERLDRVGRLSLAETARVLTHVCRALGQAHELGLVHRDIKPENVFAARIDGEAGEAYKVLDFGIAKATDQMAVDGVKTKTGALLGTPFYMSPEQARGLKTLDHRADLWSVAVVAFECLTGRRPFTAKALGPLVFKIVDSPIPSPSSVAPDAGISRELDAWMQQALSRDPEGRFQTARELASSFRLAAGLSERGDLDHTGAPFIPAEPSAVDLDGSSSTAAGVGNDSLTGTLVMSDRKAADALGIQPTVAASSPPPAPSLSPHVAAMAMGASALDGSVRPARPADRADGAVIARTDPLPALDFDVRSTQPMDRPGSSPARTIAFAEMGNGLPAPALGDAGRPDGPFAAAALPGASSRPRGGVATTLDDTPPPTVPGVPAAGAGDWPGAAPSTGSPSWVPLPVARGGMPRLAIAAGVVGGMALAAISIWALWPSGGAGAAESTSASAATDVPLPAAGGSSDGPEAAVATDGGEQIPGSGAGGEAAAGLPEPDAVGSGSARSTTPGGAAPGSSHSGGPPSVGAPSATATSPAAPPPPTKAPGLSHRRTLD